MFGGLAAGVFGRDLRRIWRRLAASLEAHHPGRAPRDGVALCVGDGDHGVVEAGVHMGDAGGDVLAFPSAETLRCLGHWSYDPLNSFALREGASSSCGRSYFFLPAI